MTLPLLPTTQVGSWPKPAYITTARGELGIVHRRATREFIKKQEELDIDVLVDGEFYRGDMATDYGRALGLPIADWTRSYNNRFWKKPIVDRKLERKQPIQLEQYLYTQSFTQKPVKAMLTGPTTLANWSFHSHYKKRENRIFAWADIIAQEVQDLAKAGAHYIQIDEPAMAEYHWEEELFKEGLKKARGTIDAYVITHICYGNFELVYNRMKDLAVEQVDIELANDLDKPNTSKVLQMMKEEPLTKYKDVAVGVIDVRPHIPVESEDTIVKRIYTTLEILAPKDELLRRIWIKPDCGFRTTKNEETAYAKIKAMMNAVKKVRENLNG